MLDKQAPTIPYQWAHWRSRLSHAANFLFLPCLLLVCIWQIASVEPAFANRIDAHLMLLNVLPFLLAGLLIWALSGRGGFSLLSIWLLMRGVYAVNQLKLQHLAEPLLPGDLLMAPQVMGNAGFFLRYAEPGLCGALLIALLAGLWWAERPGWLRRPWLRASLGAAALLIMISLAHGTIPWAGLYSRPPLVFQPWDPMGSAAKSGMPAYFVALSWGSALRPKPPDLSRIEALSARLAEPARGNSNSQRPDIIVFQSESFFDPGRINGVESSDHIPNLIALRERGLSGDLRVPAYGGKTTRTEFEVLTGISLKAVPAVQYPYQGLVHGPMQSLASGLGKLGYEALAIHPYPASFYRRSSVFPMLGFDRFIDITEFPDSARYGHFVSDEALVHRVLGELEAPGDVPRLIYAISMENHGPWHAERAAKLAQPPPRKSPPGVDTEQALVFDLFLHHLGRGDKALADLAAAVAQRQRPTLLLFFGDHLPGLHQVFSTLGFRNGRKPWEQTVPFVLLHNRRALRGTLDLDSSELASLLLEAAELPVDGHFAELSRLRAPHDLSAQDAEALKLELGRLALANASAAQPGQSARVTILSVSPSPLTMRAGSDEPVLLSVRTSGLPSRAGLSLAGESLPVTQVGDTLIARVPAELLEQVLQGAKAPDLRLQVGNAESSLIAQLKVRASDPRSTSGRFCQVGGWGPDSTRVSQPVNRQPDGSEGFWIKLDCYPNSTRVLIDGEAIAVTHQANMITGRIPLEKIASPGNRAVELHDQASGERLLVGNIAVQPAAQ